MRKQRVKRAPVKALQHERMSLISCQRHLPLVSEQVKVKLVQQLLPGSDAWFGFVTATLLG